MQTETLNFSFAELGEAVQRMLFARARRVGFPERHLQQLGNLDATGPWGDCYARLQARLGQGFIVALLGARGPGKSQLAVALGSQVLFEADPEFRHDEGKFARYTKAADMLRSIRERTVDGRECSETVAVETFVRPRILIIDEAGERAFTEFEGRTLNNIIDRRYDAMRDTILIANLDKQAFAQSVGPSVTSRMQETGAAILCDWPSFRTPETARRA